MKTKLLVLLRSVVVAVLVFAASASPLNAVGAGAKKVEVVSFASNGYYKMLYDRRQRPQSVAIGDKVHIVYNGGVSQTESGKKVRVKPTIITYDVKTKEFSKAVELDEQSSDHHFAPVVFSDSEDHIHVLYGCHRTPGVHLVSTDPNSIGSSAEDWSVGAEISSSISYPTFYRMAADRQVAYYRFLGHSGEWTYSYSDDDGKSWVMREEPVTNLDMLAYPEWSSYQTKFPSADGKYLHVVFMDYDDNKKNVASRLYNPRYDKSVGNGWKYNLFYVHVDIATGEVTNFAGEPQSTPIHRDQAEAACKIWDTDWRGAGVPPDIVLDKDGNPAMLHVLSEESTEQHNYYFVKYDKKQKKWRQTVIAPSNHQWNSCHIALDKRGVYHAYLLMSDEQYLNSKGSMELHGGGRRIEEWVSKDEGMTWSKKRDLTPSANEYDDFRYSNIQPVTTPQGDSVDGLFIFYGWKSGTRNQAQAFLMNLNN